MEFDRLLGNEQLKTRLLSMLRRRQLSHCFLICGPEGSGKRTLAELLCEALECTSAGTPPCGVCTACRKVRTAGHPDVIFVDDDEHQSIPIDRVRAACADVFIRPNEGSRKIYVFPHAEKLSVADQNALLKILEEPPAYAVFLLLLPNAGQLLPTVRSRCATFRLSPIPQSELLPALRDRVPGHTAGEYEAAAASGYLGQAIARLSEPPRDDVTRQFAAAFAAKDTLALLAVLTASEKLRRDALQERLTAWETVLTDALRARYLHDPDDPNVHAIRTGRTAAEILCAADAVRQAEVYCGANVSPAAVCGALAVKLS